MYLKIINTTNSSKERSKVKSVVKHRLLLYVCRYFDEDAFEHVSAEARDFISNLLIRERRWH